MKYFILSQWVKENSSIKLQIEKATVNSPMLEIHFTTGDKLVCLYQSSSPFPYFSDFSKTAENGSTIWQQIVKTELYRIEIDGSDRIIRFYLQARDIYQQTTDYRLIFECMPPRGNLILCRKDSGKLMILDALDKYSFADNPHRQILPGMEYQSPNTGFSPVKEEIRYPLQIKIADKEYSFLNINGYFQTYFDQVILKNETDKKKARLYLYWQKELKKTELKLNKQQSELDEANKESLWLTFAEIIKTNLGTIHKGDCVLTAVNYYDPALKEITIPLHRDKSPKDNLNIYLKKYHKAKQGKAKIKLQIDRTNTDIGEIKEILSSFETDKWQDLEQKNSSASQAVVRLKQADSLFRIKVNDDWEIVVGRKARENDIITTQLGRPEDWWFHTRIYRGSHILLRNFNKKPPPDYLFEACSSLAAWFSKAKNSENVPVDFTQIRYVRKPRKSAAGFVTYSNHKTVFANPRDVNETREFVAKHAG